MTGVLTLGVLSGLVVTAAISLAIVIQRISRPPVVTLSEGPLVVRVEGGLFYANALAVKDTSAEPTGFIFSDDGMTAYVSVQHSDDSKMDKVDGYGTDDLVKITGFKAPAGL